MNCAICGRELSHPASIEAGMGPVCAGVGHWPSEPRPPKPRGLKTGRKKHGPGYGTAGQLALGQKQEVLDLR